MMDAQSETVAAPFSFPHMYAERGQIDTQVKIFKSSCLEIGVAVVCGGGARCTESNAFD